MTDEELVRQELARLAAVQAPDGYERAYVRAHCLRAIGTANAAAVLRQEALCVLAGDSPWYGPASPMPTWYTERHRIAFLAGVARCVSYRVPEDHEIRTLIRNRRARRLAAAEGSA